MSRPEGSIDDTGDIVIHADREEVEEALREQKAGNASSDLAEQERADAARYEEYEMTNAAKRAQAWEDWSMASAVGKAEGPRERTVTRLKAVLQIHSPAGEVLERKEF